MTASMTWNVWIYGPTWFSQSKTYPFFQRVCRIYRYFDPATGRYLESDPIDLNGGSSTYAYIEGNPLNTADLYGLADCTMTYHLDHTATVHCVSSDPSKPPVDLPVASGNNGGG